MSGLSDSAWEELAAEIDGPAAAEPLPAEPDSPEALAQTAPDASAPDVTEDAPAEQAAEPAESDPRIAELEAREAAIAQREQDEAEKQRVLAAQWLAWQEQEAEKRSNAYYQKLVEENGEDVANEFMGLQRTNLQMRREAENRAFGAEHGLTAAMIALEQVVTPEQFQQILGLTENLVTYPDATQMQAAIQQERQRTQTASAELRALQETVRELRSRLDAQERPRAADAVDGGQGGPGSGTSLADEPDFDTFFGRLTQTLPQSWQPRS